MIPGTQIKLGDRTLLLPPLNVHALELHKDFIVAAARGEIDGTSPLEQMVMAAELVHASLARNYPEITLEEVKLHVDLGNMAALLANVFKTSGFTESAGE